MGKWKRWIAAVLLACMIVTMLPPGSNVKAAAGDSYVFQLDTDGIDAGAQYLIVSGNSGSAAALKMDPATPWQSSQAAVTVQADGTVAAFDGDSACLWSFSSAYNGTVSSNGYYLNVGDYTHYTSTAATVQYTHFGNGAYGIYIRGGSNDNLLYLHYGYDSSVSANRWYTVYNWGKAGTDPTAYQSYVYLYKLVEQDPGFSVTYNGNGHTSGQLPEGVTGVESGTVYTVLPPAQELRKESGEDVYLFRCWNTKADGSGTEYAPGETFTVTENTTLYAEWYLQNRFAVTVHTYLDDVLTDKNVILGEDVTICISADEETYLELERTAEGTYTGYVTENGTYSVWLKTGDTYNEAHGHKIVIYNQGSGTELLNYSVSYDANGGTWQDGQAPEAKNYHANHQVMAVEQIPLREGCTFLGWQDQNGNLIAPGGVVTETLSEKTVLTALWEERIDVTVNITLDHKPVSGGTNTADDMHQVTIQLLQEQDGVNLPVQELTLDETQLSWVYDTNTGMTTYSYVFTNLPQGQYHAVAHKSHYGVTKRTHSGQTDTDQTIEIDLQYEPGSFDLSFTVKVEHTEETKALMPKAVNLKVLCWDGETWTVISQQAGEHGLPVTVTIDENGEGSGFYPVWQHWPNEQDCYVYRVAVSSFVMPDDSVLPASGDVVTYTADGSGLYTATVSMEAEGTGKIPAYPEPDQTTLTGAYYDGSADDEQNGVPTVTVQITPFTVTFDAGDGMLNGDRTLVLTNQYRYPRLSDYKPVCNHGEHKFAGWLLDGVPAQDLEDSYLTGDVTFVATYSTHIDISGHILVDATYDQEGQTVWVPETDRAESILVLLQKNINGVYNDVESQLVDITYEGTQGTGSYNFRLLPQDNVAYRVQVVTHNYVTLYNNNGVEQDGQPVYTLMEYDVLMDENSVQPVDMHLMLSPESYSQWYRVDASQISESFRPDSILARILYRDVGDVHNYQVISQHTVQPYGMQVTMDDQGKGSGFWNLWNWHTNGNLYEYQLEISKLYGEGIYAADGTAPDSQAPFTVVYGPATSYQQSIGGESGVLQATLIPRQYKVLFDLNLGEDADDAILGMENFHVDSGTGSDQYAYTHTWSLEADFTAYPYREGYVFNGWTSSDEGVLVTDHGHIHVGAGVARDITLTASWIKLTGNAYTVRYLELNTDQVLHGAQACTGVSGTVKAVDEVIAITGYNYVGAMVGGTYYDKSADPQMTISEDPLQNLMVIYYLPDGSDGYTEQVEGNLSLNKTAVLEDNGTYTVQLETYTKDNPITTYIQQDTPLDIVLVLDQSGSIIQSGYLDDLQAAVNNFIALIAEHGRDHEVDHRIALVGYAGDETCAPTSTDTSAYPIAGGNTTNWVNTGVFDSNGDFHPYPVTGFNYTVFTGNPEAGGTYYTYNEGEYLLLTHHSEYRHLISEEEAWIAVLEGQTVYGYTGGRFVELTRNTSGLWLYGDKQLYSLPEFFTYHQDVWTHRKGLERRQIHAYGTGSNYSCTDGHGDLYQRTETQVADPQLSVYKDALVPVSVGAYGSGGVNPGLTASTSHLGSNGGTYVQYGISMANKIFAANPLDPQEGRVRIMVMFTDGLPGTGTFDENEANAAIAQAYTTKNTHGAYTYTVGLYTSDGVDALSNQAMFMNAVSTNYPAAQSMNDVRNGGYVVVPDGSALNSNGPYFVNVGANYYELSYSSRWVSSGGWWSGSWVYGWKYTVNGVDTYISDGAAPVVSGGQVGGYTIYKSQDIAYKPAENSGYYSTTDSEQELKDYFAHIMREITTKITTEIVLHEDTILRDIMGQGLELTDGTVITAYTQKGTYTDSGILWETDAGGVPVLTQKAQLTLGGGATSVTGEDGVSIYTYNLDAQNTTDPNVEEYHPHTVDITGYNFDDWYISQAHPVGYKMVVTITRIEARDDVQWGRSTATNNSQSGLWLPADAQGNRELLLPFKQPNTIFVERAYVLDYAKEFTLSGWYFDTEGENAAQAIHVDCDITNGMNWFDETDPNVRNGMDSAYGNTAYGNVSVEDGKVKYSPVTTSWGNYDQFYVFGNTWRKTVLAQDANENGNLWNKVTVIPANNVYYEDSFITTEASGTNGISGFTFTGAWDTVNSDADAGSNVEIPEHQENTPYGDVHGWSDSLHDDGKFTDGSAHKTDEVGAAVEFTFTGTGVDVYTRTNSNSGMVIAMLYERSAEEWKLRTGTIMDNLAVSGDYYSVPTINFHKLPYGTYKVELRATKTSANATGVERTTYWVDGIRVYNPMGSTQNYEGTVVKEAYDLEVNAVFTEVRDILLDNQTFTESGEGAVFIDWIQDGQTSGEDQVGTAQPTYEIGTFEDYGPKNEVYLAAGQAIVLRVDPANHYYVGMKSLSGGALTVNVSGIDRASPQKITLEHTTDLYYQVTPVDGYIVIQNARESAGILSVTRLRATNLTAPADNGGVLPITQAQALSVMQTFDLLLAQPDQEVPEQPPETETVLPQQPVPVPGIPAGVLLLQKMDRLAQDIFHTVRLWLAR